MGGKKKKAGGGGKEGDEEDLSVDNFMKAYKKKCSELGCVVSKIILEKYVAFQDEDEPMDKVLIYDRYKFSSTFGTSLVGKGSKRSLTP